MFKNSKQLTFRSIGCDLRIRWPSRLFWCEGMVLRMSANTYIGIYKCLKKFFRATQTPTTTLPLTHFWSNFASKRVSHVKNDQSGALEATKSFESIVGRSNLFLSKAYDLRILANTYSACHNPTKHFLKPIQVPRATFKISNFEYFCFKSGVEPVWSLKNRP